MNISNIWYANEKKHRSLTKIIVYNDIGALNIFNKGFEFEGANGKVIMNKIHSISTTRHRIPIISWLLAMPICFLFLILFYFLIKAFFGLGFNITLALFLIILFLGLLVGVSTRWVEIEHQDNAGSIVKSYFADGLNHGWRGIFGGTTQLYRELMKYHNNT